MEHFDIYSRWRYSLYIIYTYQKIDISERINENPKKFKIKKKIKAFLSSIKIK